LRDIADLQWSAVDLERRIIKVTTRKTGKTVTVPIHPQFAAWLETNSRHRQSAGISNTGW
jgi:integrase